MTKKQIKDELEPVMIKYGKKLMDVLAQQEGAMEKAIDKILKTERR